MLLNQHVNCFAHTLHSIQVLDAIANNRPVVALESTIISHGMPYPRNIEVASRVEAVIRSFGAVPATCAIINGELSILLLT